MFRSAVGRLAVGTRSAVKGGRPVSATCPVLKQSLKSSYIFQRTIASGWASPSFPLSKEASKSTETALVGETEFATGREREEFEREAQLGGPSRFETALLRGPFGTKPLARRSHPTRVFTRWWSSSGGGRESPAGGAALYELKLSQTGEGIAECELIRWFVEEGEQVASFQPICEVQSDKATVEMTSRYDGRIVRTHFVPGDIVKVGEVLCDIIMCEPDSSESSSEATPNELTSATGQSQSSEASPSAADVTHQHDSAPDRHLARGGPHGDQPQLATPAVRHLARTYGLNLAEITGSGKDGRVLKGDVLQAGAERQGVEDEARAEEYAFEGHEAILGEGELEKGRRERPAVESSLGKREFEEKDEAEPRGVAGFQGEDKVVPIRGYRRAMAKTMAAANEVPHFYYMEEVEVGPLVELRTALREEAERAGVSLSYMPLLVKALSQALHKHPMLNATVNVDVTEVHCKGSHNIGVAMATPGGLVVPNIKNCQARSVLQIAQELARLRQLAMENRLATEDLTGGTITVSNVGTIGGTYAGPLINLPQVAIVALGRIQKLPRYDADGDVYPASIMNVSWAADHRVIDGASLAALCSEWKRSLEHPARLLLHLR